MSQDNRPVEKELVTRPGPMDSTSGVAGSASPGRMVFLLGMMAFWCNGDNYAASPLQF